MSKRNNGKESVKICSISDFKIVQMRPISALKNNGHIYILVKYNFSMGLIFRRG